MDWTDPNTWKAPAALIDYWKTIVVGLVAIGGAVGGMLRWGFGPIRWVWSKIKGGPRRRPISLSFVQSDRECRWSVARRGEELGTHVHGHWHVTNSSEGNVVLLKARLGRYQTEFGFVLTRNSERNVFGRNAILSHRMTEVVADFSFFPSIIACIGTNNTLINLSGDAKLL